MGITFPLPTGGEFTLHLSVMLIVAAYLLELGAQGWEKNIENGGKEGHWQGAILHATSYGAIFIFFIEVVLQIISLLFLLF